MPESARPSGRVMPVGDFEVIPPTDAGPPMTPPDPQEAAERELLMAAHDPQGWGDRVAAALHRIGADQAYKLLRRTAGLVESCGGCNKRRVALNRLEQWVKSAFSKD